MPPRGKKATAKKPSPRTRKNAAARSKTPLIAVEEATEPEIPETIVGEVPQHEVTEPEIPENSVEEVPKHEVQEPAAPATIIEEEKSVPETKIVPENEIVPEEGKIVVEEEVLQSTEVVSERQEVEVSTVKEATIPITMPETEDLTETKESAAESANAVGEISGEPEEIADEVKPEEIADEVKPEEIADYEEPEEMADEEEPEEIANEVNESETIPMDQEPAALGAEQEIVPEETGDGEIKGTEGGGGDIAGLKDGNNKVEDGNKSGSDEEEDNGENEELEDPSVYMHAPLSDRKKQKEFEIFVGGLDKEAVEEDLIKVFSVYGEIQAARIVKHPTTQKSKGFAFIRYATVEQAKRALAELKDGTEVRGKRVGISASQDNDTLYMGNICKTWTKDQVFETLKAYAVEQIEEIFLPEDPKNEGKNKGFVLLEFNTHSDAMAAFQRLRKPDAVFGCDRSARVAFAQSSMHPSEEALSQVKTVYVEGLPFSWDEEKVNDYCKQYGEIEKVQLSRNFNSAKRKDFGFIAFTSRESAVACMEGINNAQLGEGDIKVKANLAKPQNKGRLAKQGARGGFKVKKDRGSIEEPGHSRMKGNSKFKGAEGKGKAHGKLKSSGRGGRPSRPPVRGSQGQGAAPPADHHRNGQKFIGGKRGGRSLDIGNNGRPSKKARNFYGRPNNDFGNQNNPRYGKPKANFMPHPAPYRAPYTSVYGAPAPSYQAHGYGAASGSKLRSSDMEPHAGYLEPAMKQGRDPHIYGAGAYDSHVKTGVGYVAGPMLPPSYPPQYSSYPGYEAAPGYGYPSSSSVSAPYPPRRGGY